MVTRNPSCQCGLVPMEVTEGDSGASTAVIYRDSYPSGFSAKMLDTTLAKYGNDVTVFTGMMTGVYYTGKRFFATKIGTNWYAASTGEVYWSTAVTQADICDTGDVELFDDGPIVTAETDAGVPESTAVEIEFDDQRQMFIIIGVRCPAPYVGAPA